MVVETNIPKPMLAYSVKNKLHAIKYPAVVQEKYDGVRIRKWRGLLWSRSGKLIPNKELHVHLSYLPDGVEGELIMPHQQDWTEAQSVAMSAASPYTNAAIMILFDTFHPDLAQESYTDRLAYLKDEEMKWSWPLKDVTVVASHTVYTFADLQMHIRHLAVDSEGLICRNPKSPYKHGRSGLRHQELLKIKALDDMEAEIVGLRSVTRVDGTVDNSRIGRLACITPDNVLFSVGSGISDVLRREMALNKSMFLGKFAKIQYMNLTPNGVPRSPVFTGIRNQDDMS